MYAADNFRSALNTSLRGEKNGIYIINFILSYMAQRGTYTQGS